MIRRGTAAGSCRELDVTAILAKTEKNGVQQMLKGGSRFPVAMADVFPHGCHLVPDSISEAIDYDEETKRRSPASDKLSGRSREVVVKVIADRMPVPPTRAPFEPVEFENLTVTPYVIDRTKRMGYSLRATGIKAGRPMAQPGKDAA